MAGYQTLRYRLRYGIELHEGMGEDEALQKLGSAIGHQLKSSGRMG